jgi:hypothetical protein
MEAEDPVVKSLRSIFNMFKQSYVNEQSDEDSEDDSNETNNTNNTKQNIEAVMSNVKNHIGDLHNIVMRVIKANGHIPADFNEKQRIVSSVFEKRGVFPALRANPALKEKLEYYTILDLGTFTYTTSPKHIDILTKKGVKPINVIIGNDVLNSDENQDV